MLVLTRRLNEDIVIGDNIIIRILDIRDRNHVKIGVIAPEHISVYRKEVHERMKGEGDDSAQPTAG